MTVLGATGFTGQLLLQYLCQRAPPTLTLAVAGRDTHKLDALVQQFPRLASVYADATVYESLDSMAAQTRVLINLAGPYDKYGTGVVRACVRHNTQYCDITGEAFWYKKMIQAFHQEACEAKTLVVSFCGFDSVPFDLPVLKLAQLAREQYGCGIGKVQSVVDMKGGISGGTFQSFLNAFEKKYATSAEYAHPYALNPKDDPEFPPDAVYVRPEDKDFYLPWYDSKKAEWRNFFVMHSTNSKVIRRSQRLFKQAGFDYGKNFVYLSEAQKAKSLFRAILVTVVLVLFAVLASIPFTRRLLQKYGPQSGSGPSAKRREKSRTAVTVTAEIDNGSKKEVSIFLTGRDLGYTDTAKMVVECALILATKKNELKVQGGVVTPAFAFGTDLLDTLNDQKILNYQILQ